MRIPLSLQADIGTGFEKALYNEVRKHINQAMHNAVFDIGDEIGDFFEKKFKESKYYKAITSGQLRGDLGLVDPISDLDAIIDTIKENVFVSVTPISGGQGKISRGGISFGIIRSSYKDILSLPEATYVSSGKSGHYLIEWLRWLITRGDDVIIDDYIVVYGSYSTPPSRTGEAIMFKKNGGIYRIPPQYSGIPGDNMLTRVLEKYEKSIQIILQKCIRRYL